MFVTQNGRSSIYPSFTDPANSVPRFCMTRWTRTRDLSFTLGSESLEVWELRDDGKPVVSFPMAVRLGKPFDVLRMKGQSSGRLRGWASETREAITHLYAKGVPRGRLSACPCCGDDTAHAELFATIYQIEYRRCGGCAHVFVADQPASEVINRAFADNDTYAHEYTSPEQIELRLREIVEPKLDWVRAVYRRQYDRDLSSALDVGAGGGHFVAGCRRARLSAEGYEINKSAIAFAQTALGVELRSEDFLGQGLSDESFDAVTLWGLLEYTTEPVRFIEAARRHLSADRGMLIVEVPRAEAFSSAIQSALPQHVWRHLSPASHMNVYSDASIATLLHNNGFRPIAAWYFGMDFYELLCQFAAALDDDRVLSELGSLIAPMQAWLDTAQLVDDLIIAAVPV